VRNIIFIHGLESSGEGYKAKFLKNLFPETLTPNFSAYSSKIPVDHLLNARMDQLEELVQDTSNWIIIGSSFGGLMGTIYSLKNPQKVKLLILLAPFLTSPKYYDSLTFPIDIPVFAIHGIHDTIVSARKAKEYAKTLFSNLEYVLVDDDHQLHQTVGKLNWMNLINEYPIEKKIVPIEIIRQ
jgi:pimeloyl-ACP methyl ester carboxylesterase